MEAILLYVGLLLLFAKICGNIAERFGIASLAGEVIAGIILGPILGIVILGDFMIGLMTLGASFLLFLAGMEARFDDIRDNSYRAVFLAALGGLLSLLGGVAVGMLFFNDFLIGMAIGTAIIFTSNGALFLLLMKSGKFNSHVGKLLIATTIADDIIGVMALSLFHMYVNSTVSWSSLFTVALVSLGFYLFIMTVGSKRIGKVLDSLAMYTDESILFTVPIAIMLLLSVVTENLGLSTIAGAFLAGMSVANSRFAGSVIVPKVKVMAQGFLLPLFYASIGTLVVLTGIDILLILAIVGVAVVGKFVGCGMMSWFLNLKPEDMKLVGVAMIPRGDENIAILQVIGLGLLSQSVYSSIAFAIVITTVLAPLLMRIFIE